MRYLLLSRWANHVCRTFLRIHSNSISDLKTSSSLTWKAHYLELADTQYHLRRTGRGFPFNVHRLPLMLTDLIQADSGSHIRHISLFCFSPLELFAALPITVAWVTNITKVQNKVEGRRRMVKAFETAQTWIWKTGLSWLVMELIPIWFTVSTLFIKHYIPQESQNSSWGFSKITHRGIQDLWL